MALLKKCTPVLIVDAIEPSLPFFAAIGLEPAMSVPETVDGQERIGFTTLTGDALEVMLQTASSVKADMPALEPVLHHRAHLFVEVDGKEALAKIKDALAAFKLAMPERTTFYGSTEVGYEEPGGHHLTFAAFG